MDFIINFTIVNNKQIEIMKATELKLKQFRSLVNQNNYKALAELWNIDFNLRSLYDEILNSNNIRVFVMAELVENPNNRLIKVF